MRGTRTAARLRINAVESSLAILAGAALVLLTLLDLALTTLHVQSESPFSTRLNRLVWWVLARASCLVPERLRDEMLGWALPLMLGVTMAAWALAYIVGFALVHLPHIHDPASFAAPNPRSPLEDALFFSGATFFNIGSNEITPVGTVARTLTVLEGGAGLLTISLAVTYLLSVYPVISRKTAFADALNQVTGGRADGVVAAQRYLSESKQHYEALVGRLERLNDELLYLAHAHRLYPVLYYVRSREVHESFARILALAQGLVATLRYGLDPASYPDVVSDPRVLMLEEGLLDSLHLLARSSHLSVPPAAGPDDGEFDVLRARLAEHGLRTMPADDASRRRYARFQQATEPYIRAYARNIRYPVEAVWATYDRPARGAAFDAGTSGAPGGLATPPRQGVERDGQQQHGAGDHELDRRRPFAGSSSAWSWSPPARSPPCWCSSPTAASRSPD